MADVIITGDSSNLQAAVDQATRKVEVLEKEVTTLDAKLKTQEKTIATLSSRYADLTKASALASTSLSSLAAVQGKYKDSMTELNTKLSDQYAKMTKVAGATDIYYANLRKAGEATLALKSQISGLNSAFAEKASLQGKLNLLSNASYVAMKKESEAIKEQIRLKEIEVGLRKAEAPAKEKAAGATLMLAQALDKEAASRLKLSMLDNEAYVTALRNTKEIDNQARSRMQALGLIEREEVNTRKLDDAQRTLHQTARGLSGAMGSLWLTYGQPMAPMIAGFAAAASAMGSIKLSGEIEYTTKLIETLSTSFGEAGTSAEVLRENLHSLKDTRKGIDDLAFGLKEFIKAGVDSGTAMKHLEEMARFATIAEIDMAQAIKLVVAASNAFGTDFTEAANKISAAAFATTTDVKELGHAMSYATPLGSVLGISFSETATAMGLLAQKGIESSKAGTSLTTTFMRLAAPTEAAKKAMQDLGVEFSAFDEHGKLKTMRQQLIELSEIFSTLSEEKAVDLMGALSDLRSMKGLGNLIQDMAGDAKAWDDLYAKIDNANKGITLLKQTSANLDETVTAKWDKFVATIKRVGESTAVSNFSSTALNYANQLAGAVEMLINPVDTYTTYIGEPFVNASNSAIEWVKKLAGAADESERIATPALKSISDQALETASKLLDSAAKPAPQLNIFQILGLPEPSEAEKQFSAWKAFMSSITVGGGKELSKGDLLMSESVGRLTSLDSWHEKVRIDERQKGLYKEIDEAAKERARSEKKLRNEAIATAKKNEELRLKELKDYEEKEKLQKMELLGYFGLQAAKTAQTDSFIRANEDVVKSLEEAARYQNVINEFNAELKELQISAGMVEMSELDKELASIDTQFAKIITRLQNDGLGEDEIKEARVKLDDVKEALKKIKAIELGDDIFAGFIQGLKDSSKEAITLGKIGMELGKTFTSELGATFKDIFSGENENPYADSIASINDKIKSMQYESLEGGVAQLEWLRREYDQSLEGAMAGNKEMFDQYMSNLDSYLDKAKEEMNPEEYKELYAQTMEDLNKLNDEFAGKTESTWDRIGDAFGDMADRMMDKFADMVADMMAQDIAGAIGGAFSGVSGSSGSSTGSSWIGTALDSAWNWVSSLEWASGGWLGANPRGGVIRQGSGTRDDVFLGMTGGTANFGMGGEFVVNKEATAAYLPLLENINAQGFASGGMVGGQSATAQKFIFLAEQLQNAGYSADVISATLARALEEYGSTIERVTDATNGATQASMDLSSATVSSTQATVSSTEATKQETSAKASNIDVSDALGKVVGTVGVNAVVGFISAMNPALGLVAKFTDKTLGLSDALGKQLSKAFDEIGVAIADMFGLASEAMSAADRAYSDASAAVQGLVSQGYMGWEVSALSNDNTGSGILGGTTMGGYSYGDPNDLGGGGNSAGGGISGGNSVSGRDPDKGSDVWAAGGYSGSNYIVNKRATAKYLPLLTSLNSRGFADGGNLEYIQRITDDFRYTIAVASMDDITKEIYDLNRSYDEQKKKLEELSATTEDFTLLEQARNIELSQIQEEYNEEQLETAKKMAEELADIMYDIRYELRTGVLTEYQQQIQDLWENHKESAEKLKELNATYEDMNLMAELSWRKINAVVMEQAQSNLDDARDMLEAAFSAEKDSLTKKYEEVMKGLNEQLDAAKQKVSELERIVDSLDSALKTLRGSDTVKESTFFAAQADLRRRGLSGDTSGDISDTLSEAVKFDTAYYASAEEYQIDVLKSMRFIEGLNYAAGEQLTAAEEQVTSLEDQISLTRQNHEEQLAALDAQLQSLLGIEDTVLSIADAIAAYNSANSRVTGLKGGGSAGTVFNTSDYIQAKAESLVRGGWATSVEDAATMFLQALSRDNVTPQQHYERWGEMEKIYNLSSPTATAEPTSYGSPGSFSTADYIQAKASSLFNQGYAGSIEAAKEAFLSAIAKDNVTPEQHYAAWGAQEGIYHFATGGSFTVGGPGGTDNLTLPAMRVSAGEVVNVTQGDVMAELKNEIVALRAELAKVASNTAATAKQLSRWDGDGMPEVRTI